MACFHERLTQEGMRVTQYLSAFVFFLLSVLQPNLDPANFWVLGPIPAQHLMHI